MPTLITTFPDGSQLIFDTGQFDDWCVYIVDNNRRVPPRDIEYFTRLNELKNIHGDKVYKDFVEIYEKTNAQIKAEVLKKIRDISQSYNTDALEMEKLFSILYAGMVAEENKKNTKLKKRIKRLGLHQVLIDNLKPYEAANFSRGKKWQEIAKECEKRGF